MLALGGAGWNGMGEVSVEQSFVLVPMLNCKRPPRGVCSRRNLDPPVKQTLKIPGLCIERIACSYEISFESTNTGAI